MKTINVNVPIIRNDKDLDRALAQVRKLMKDDPEKNADEIRVIGLVIEAYEDEHYPMGETSPVSAIQFAMEQRGYTNKDLAEILGAQPRASEIMNGKRSLSIDMIRRLHEQWKIPLESLVGVAKTDAA